MRRVNLTLYNLVVSDRNASKKQISRVSVDINFSLAWIGNRL